MDALIHLVLTCVVAWALLHVPFRILGLRMPKLPLRLGLRALRRLMDYSLLLLKFVCVTLPTATIRAIGARLGETSKVLRCTKGCGRRVPATAVVTCRGCGYRSRRNLFAPCPACGATSRHIHCPHCRMSIPRRALWTQQQGERRYR